MKREGAVFLVEEPEVFLHPQKARYFAGVLARLAEQGNQVMVSTHSPVFVGLDRPESVAVVRRTEERGTGVRRPGKVELAASERQALRLMTEFVRSIEPSWSETRKKNEEERNHKHAKWNSDLTDAVEVDRLFFLKPNFEVEVGLPQGDEEKVDQALKRFAQAAAKDIPDCLRRPIERLLQ